MADLAPATATLQHQIERVGKEIEDLDEAIARTEKILVDTREARAVRAEELASLHAAVDLLDIVHEVSS
ncbi:hypothetical protein [Actinotalea sp. JY-7876]|uniref:hypothetical protein n=1 Tax=Actinotalea sp. JY-7876 TaxID=2758442 RepID=UPI0015F66CE3|nr:hypothetical protein [Actinotalea sp. JY-7876]